MQAKYRLKKNYQYNIVYKKSKSVSDGNFVVLYCKSNQKQSQAGFSVSKKYGHAVRRNRIRRQMKSVVAKLMPSVIDHRYIVVVPRKHQPYDYATIESSLTQLFCKAGLLQ